MAATKGRARGVRRLRRWYPRPPLLIGFSGSGLPSSFQLLHFPCLRETDTGTESRTRSGGLLLPAVGWRRRVHTITAPALVFGWMVVRRTPTSDRTHTPAPVSLMVGLRHKEAQPAAVVHVVAKAIDPVTSRGEVNTGELPLRFCRGNGAAHSACKRRSHRNIMVCFAVGCLVPWGTSRAATHFRAPGDSMAVCHATLPGA